MFTQPHVQMIPDHLTLIRPDPYRWVRSLRLDERTPQEREHIIGWLASVAMDSGHKMMSLSCNLPESLRLFFESISKVGSTANWEELPGPIAGQTLGKYMKEIQGEIPLPLDDSRDRMANPGKGISIDEFMKALHSEDPESSSKFHDIIRGIGVVAQGVGRPDEYPLNPRGQQLIRNYFDPEYFEGKEFISPSRTSNWGQMITLGCVFAVILISVAFFTGAAVSSWIF